MTKRGKARVRWFGRKFQSETEQGLETKLDALAYELQGDIVKSMKKGNLSGKTPSEPGDPPAVVSSDLRDSIKWFKKSSLVRVVGSALKPQGGQSASYALYLELGTRKMQKRPFLRPRLDDLNFRRKLKKILGT